MTSIEHLVNEWLRLDQNEASRAEVQSLWDSGNIQELEKRMRTRIEFGTAVLGLRGRMEAGWSRMNDLIIIQASQGLCAYVMTQVDNAAIRGVVIGHDHRHNSGRWARLTAAAFVAKGMKVYLLRGLVHTPMVPFSVKKLGAACGVMITASHNPKQDNGYKVYWENAVQIIAPHDNGISNSIKANLQPQTWATDNLQFSPLCIDPTDEMHGAYFATLADLNLSYTLNKDLSIKFVNTSMHGVSDPFASRAFSSFGFAPYIAVPEQQLPDPEFPTVRFPNPEEKGALDLALQTAERVGATYVLAQDPDGDRFSAAEKNPNGGWTNFTGDQLGVLFAYRTLKAYQATGKPINKLAMITTTVSSKMIKSIARIEGFHFAECLTGFKFIGNTALSLVEQGFEVPFAYEEAIGFMFGSKIRDKDGVAAAVSFAELVASLYKQGKTVELYLQELYQRYGYFETSNGYFTCADPPTIDRIFARIRTYENHPVSDSSISSPSYPHEIAGFTITHVIDLSIGYDSANPPTYKPSLPLSSGHMVQFHAESDSGSTKISLTIRTSGTEPKIKYYLEGNGTDVELVSSLLPKIVVELRDIWLEAQKNNLGWP